MICHLAAGVEHEVFNPDAVPFRHLLVSNPYVGELEPDNAPNAFREADKSLVYKAVEAVRTQFIDNLHFGYAIFDAEGNLIFQGTGFPEYCIRSCDPGGNPGGCPCMAHVGEREDEFSCPYGMEVFQEEVQFGETTIGFIQGGYVRRSREGEASLEGVYEYPKTVVAGVRGLLRRISKALRNYCEFEQARHELLEQELRISSQNQAQRILLNDLKDSQAAVTDLRINNHFLFNTLNSMASMALDENAVALYQAIVDLSKMFHYTLRTQSAFVELGKELDYVGAYLKLQKLRYGDELEYSLAVDDDVKDEKVPFNFLQPVVENAFTHGFHGSPEKRLEITVECPDGFLEIRTVNSGRPLSVRECAVINRSMENGTSHGLSMVYNKLKSRYGDGFVFKASLTWDGETCFIFRLPYQGGPG